MLVLSRKPNETLVIDGDIKVTILDVHGGRVRIGIDAHEEIKIHRKELYQNLQAQKKEEINE